MVIFRPLLVFTITSLMACSASAAPNQNPPPEEKFSAFQVFEMAPIEIPAKQRDKDRAIDAAQKIAFAINKKVGSQLTSWTKNTPQARTLLIEPQIEDLKVVNGATRFFAGPFAGSSRVTMKVKFTDKATGKVIAEPQFYQQANAMAGAMSVGGADNAMLYRIGSLIGTYIETNYSDTVGGATTNEASDDMPAPDGPTGKVE